MDVNPELLRAIAAILSALAGLIVALKRKS